MNRKKIQDPTEWYRRFFLDFVAGLADDESSRPTWAA